MPYAKGDPPKRRATETGGHYCACGADLISRYERRTGKCLECEAQDERMKCAYCRRRLVMAYADGRPTFCSDQCEDHYYSL